MSGSVVLVTGASSGIGRAVAIAASRQGSRVVALARRERELAQVVNEMDGTGHVAVPFDLLDSAGISTMLDDVVSRTGPLDGLVHAAGIHSAMPLRGVTPEQASQIFSMNVTTALMLTKGFRRRHIRGSSPSVVFISSVAGIVGEPGVSLYSATKGAVEAMSRSLAIELVREGIRCNSIAAGMVSTGLSDGIRAAVGPEAWARIEADHPLGIGAAEDIAQAALYLLSPASRWVVGSTLVIDGGYTAQ